MVGVGHTGERWSLFIKKENYQFKGRKKGKEETLASK